MEVLLMDSLTDVYPEKGSKMILCCEKAQESENMSCSSNAQLSEFKSLRIDRFRLERIVTDDAIFVWCIL